MEKSKKQIIIELLEIGNDSDDIIALEAGSTVSYVKKIEKEIYLKNN